MAIFTIVFQCEETEAQVLLSELKTRMYAVMSDICDLLGSISMDEMLSLTSVDTNKLQKLLAQRSLFASVLM